MFQVLYPSARLRGKVNYSIDPISSPYLHNYDLRAIFRATEPQRTFDVSYRIYSLSLLWQLWPRNIVQKSLKEPLMSGGAWRRRTRRWRSRFRKRSVRATGELLEAGKTSSSLLGDNYFRLLIVFRRRGEPDLDVHGRVVPGLGLFRMDRLKVVWKKCQRGLGESVWCNEAIVQ